MLGQNMGRQFKVLGPEIEGIGPVLLVDTDATC